MSIFIIDSDAPKYIAPIFTNPPIKQPMIILFAILNRVLRPFKFSFSSSSSFILFDT
jgi:hypothetical protein